MFYTVGCFEAPNASLGCYFVMYLPSPRSVCTFPTRYVRCSPGPYCLYVHFPHIYGARLTKRLPSVLRWGFLSQLWTCKGNFLFGLETPFAFFGSGRLRLNCKNRVKCIGGGNECIIDITKLQTHIACGPQSLGQNNPSPVDLLLWDTTSKLQKRLCMPLCRWFGARKNILSQFVRTLMFLMPSLVLEHWEWSSWTPLTLKSCRKPRGLV